MNGFGKAANGFGGGTGFTLHFGNFRSDLFGCLHRLGSKVFDFPRHHCKALACIAGTCGFNCRVKCQQVCLIGNVADQADNFTNTLCRFVQHFDTLIGAFGFRNGMLGDFGNTCDLRCDFRNRRGKLRGCRCNGFDVSR